MTDDALREVLRSPLDHLPHPHRRGWVAPAATLLVGAAVGFGATAGFRALTVDEAAAPAPTTTTTAASVTTLPTLIPFGEVGAEVITGWEQGGSLYLVVATVVPPGADQAQTVGPASAHWVLQLGSSDRRPATAELLNPRVPGLFTLEFPAADILGQAQLLAYPAVEVLEEVFPAHFASAVFPWEGPATGASYRIGDEAVVVDRLHLDDAGGEFAWHLAGGSAARAVVSARATYTEAGGAAQALAAESDLPFAWLVAPSGGIPATRSGVIHLFHLDDAAAPTYRSRFWGDPARVVEVTDLTVEISVRLYHYADEPDSIPVDLTLEATG